MPPKQHYYWPHSGWSMCLKHCPLVDHTNLVSTHLYITLHLLLHAGYGLPTIVSSRTCCSILELSVQQRDGSWSIHYSIHHIGHNIREPWSACTLTNLLLLQCLCISTDRRRKIVPTGNISSPLPLSPPSLLYFPPSPPSPLPPPYQVVKVGELLHSGAVGTAYFAQTNYWESLGQWVRGKRDDSDEGKGGRRGGGRGKKVFLLQHRL